MKYFFVGILCFIYVPVFAQAGSEIILFDLQVKNGEIILMNGKNISKHKGYDNQPFFHPRKPVIFYTSSNDTARIDSSDIKLYDYEKGKTSLLTKSPDREYSPTVTPDEKYISCILQRRNGAQDLAKYPIEGGQPQVLINDLTVGYHAWASPTQVLLFVLDDSVNFSLRLYDVSKKEDVVLAKNIGRSLHSIPGQNAMSFVQKISDKNWMIKKLDVTTLATSDLISTLPGKDHLTWLRNNIILMSDGKQIFFMDATRKDVDWKLVQIHGDTSFLKNITRLSTNIDNTKLAVVVTE
jgi:hypothetical protein